MPSACHQHARAAAYVSVSSSWGVNGDGAPAAPLTCTCLIWSTRSAARACATSATSSWQHASRPNWSESSVSSLPQSESSVSSLRADAFVVSGPSTSAPNTALALDEKPAATAMAGAVMGASPAAEGLPSARALAAAAPERSAIKGHQGSSDAIRGDSEAIRMQSRVIRCTPRCTQRCTPRCTQTCLGGAPRWAPDACAS